MYEFSLTFLWAATAATLIIAEVFTATFFIFCFGAGAAVAAIVSALGFSVSIQLAVFLISSTIFVLGSRRFADAFSKEPDRKAGVDRVIGLEGTVVDEISETGTGSVSVLREEWRAISEDNKAISSETRVVVTGVSGTHLIVAPK